MGESEVVNSGSEEDLADLGTHLSPLTIYDEHNKVVNDTEEWLNAAQDKIMSWEKEKESMLWYSFPDEANFDYLNAVGEIGKLTERLLSLENNDAGNGLLQRARDILQKAMSRLEQEFSSMLAQVKQQFDLHMTSLSSQDGISDEASSTTCSNGTFNSLQGRSVSEVSDESLAYWPCLDVIRSLRCVAELMFASQYDRECCMAYISTRKDYLETLLSFLEIETPRAEDVMKMALTSSKTKRWIRAIKVFVGVFACERNLCDQIFGELGSAGSFCFVESTEVSLRQLLNFGEAISKRARRPENLFGVLDMYEVLTEFLPDMNSLYSYPAGSTVQTEYQAFLKTLGDSVTAVLVDFKNEIASNASATPFAGGGIHPFTRYVMTYISSLGDYRETLDSLFTVGYMALPLVEMDRAEEEDSIGGPSLSRTKQIALHFKSFAAILESNLYNRSQLYKDASLQHFFLMNNAYYMAYKVRNSELTHILGDDWTREQMRKVRHHALEYEKATLRSTLNLLKAEVIQDPQSNSVFKTLLKEKLRSFNLAFKEIYRNQTAWMISDAKLREDLQISLSLKVIPAYHSFVRRYAGSISKKHLKFSIDDLQSYLLDLFRGSPKSL